MRSRKQRERETEPSDEESANGVVKALEVGFHKLIESQQMGYEMVAKSQTELALATAHFTMLVLENCKVPESQHNAVQRRSKQKKRKSWIRPCLSLQTPSCTTSTPKTRLLEPFARKDAVTARSSA